MTQDREPSVETREAIWRGLLEKDDRTSPADYPDMALITRDELFAYLDDFAAQARTSAPYNIDRAVSVLVDAGRAKSNEPTTAEAREAASKAWYERITTQSTVHGMIEELAITLDDFRAEVATAERERCAQELDAAEIYGASAVIRALTTRP
jgi:hypothetical protein